jgi:hypothetical protein
LACKNAGNAADKGEKEGDFFHLTCLILETQVAIVKTQVASEQSQAAFVGTQLAI